MNGISENIEFRLPAELRAAPISEILHDVPVAAEAAA